MEQYYKRKKQEQFFSFHDEATWTLAFGQVKCCLQTSLINYFNIFLNKKNFKKQILSHFQKPSTCTPHKIVQ
jgi:hypothetical protein